MLPEKDFDLTNQYYRLRGQYIFYRQVLERYHRHGAQALVLGRFSSLCHGFVHDLGNGLNAIRSKLERLAAQNLSPEHMPALAHATALCDGCGWRLYSLQEISPSPPVYPEPVNLPRFIPRILEVLAAWKPASVQVKFRTTETRLIVADYAHLLRLALLEPLLNAFQALPDGGLVGVSLQKLANGLAQIEIADTGPGLPLGDPEACFDIHFTTRRHRYGVGLYVARKVVEKHRGTLRLGPKPGGGARVVIELPIGDPEPDWEDESALVQELEILHDGVASQEQAVKGYQAAYDLPREQMLAQLPDLFGQLSASVVQFLTAGLAGIQETLTPLASRTTADAADDIRFILEKCAYCDLVLGNARALDTDWDSQPVPADLNQLVAQVVKLMTWRVQPGAQLHMTQATSLPLICADASLVATALLNLLRNALDAAGSNGLVEVETLPVAGDAVVRLTNTGDTVPGGAQARVFDLDYTTRKGRVFGLGLPVAQAIVARHAGSIRLVDAGQSQTRWELRLPAHRGNVNVERKAD